MKFCNEQNNFFSISQLTKERKTRGNVCLNKSDINLIRLTETNNDCS